jgi:hypothetical protein
MQPPFVRVRERFTVKIERIRQRPNFAERKTPDAGGSPKVGIGAPDRTRTERGRRGEEIGSAAAGRSERRVERYA